MTRYAGCTCGARSLEPCRYCSDTVDPDVAALSKAEDKVRRIADRLENVRAGVMDTEYHPCGHNPKDPEDSCRESCVAQELDRLEAALVIATAARDAAAAEVDLGRVPS